tara:strand:+ start:1532 stop:2455 length:924 start_codon:yes stop_codon:yes gene_type:complete
MALDWSPLQIPGYLAAKTAEDTGYNIGQGLAMGSEKVFGRDDIEAKNAGEYITGYGRSYWRDELGGSDGDYKTYGEFAESNPLLKAALDGTEFKTNDLGMLSYYDTDEKDWKGWPGSGYPKETSPGEVLYHTPFYGQQGDDRDKFEATFDMDWKENIMGGEGLTYKAPKSMIGALLDPKYTYRSGKQTGFNPNFDFSHRVDNTTDLTGTGIDKVISGAMDATGYNKLKGYIGDIAKKLPGYQSSDPSPYPNIQQVPIPTEGVHLVQKGDKFDTIAYKYGLDRDTLMTLNPNISDISNISVGQTIKLR